MDDRLHEALRAAAAPRGVDDADRERMRAAVAAARHRRSVRMTVLGAVAAVLVIVAAGTVLGVVGPDGRDDQTRPAGPSGRDVAPTGDWAPIAASPLAGSANAVGVWTGTELVVAGGEEGPVCPPIADCYRSGTPSAQAAAYDPAADTWRLLPPAPQPLGPGFGVWLGDRALLVGAASGVTLLLDPATGTWEQVQDVPGHVIDGGLVVIPSKDVKDGADDAVRFSYDKRGTASPDYRFDGATGTWAPLPADPFGESYDRSMAWFDGRLWLLSMAAENHVGAYDGKPSRLAVLEGDRWRVVDPATPDLTQGQWLIPQGVLLVAAENSDPPARNQAYDPATGTWREFVPADHGHPGLPDAPDAGCLLGAAAAGPAWITAGDRLVSALPPDALEVPRCPGHAAYQVVAWAGERLILWGGLPAQDSSEPVNDGLVWVPRRPR
ncbi:hypothetical protein ABFU82_22885 [Nocardioides sp. WV_118_6]